MLQNKPFLVILSFVLGAVVSAAGVFGAIAISQKPTSRPLFPAKVNTPIPIPSPSVNPILQNKEVAFSDYRTNPSKYANNNVYMTGLLVKLRNDKDAVLTDPVSKYSVVLDISQYKGNINRYINKKARVKGVLHTVQTNDNKQELGITVEDITSAL